MITLYSAYMYMFCDWTRSLALHIHVYIHTYIYSLPISFIKNTSLLSFLPYPALVDALISAVIGIPSTSVMSAIIGKSPNGGYCILCIVAQLFSVL